MDIVAIVATYTDRTRVALRTIPPLGSSLVQEFARRSPKDYPGTIEARGGLLILDVHEIRGFPNEIKGRAIPIILARELTEAEQRLLKAGGTPSAADGSGGLPLESVDMVEPDRLRYLHAYHKDLDLPLINAD